MPEGLVNLASYPNPMQQHRELPRDSYDSSLLPVLATRRRMGQSPATEVGVRAEMAKDVVRSLDEQTPQIAIPGLCDSKLGLTRTGLASPRCQPAVSSDRSTVREAVWIRDREDECKRREGSDSWHALQEESLRVALGDELVDLTIYRLDA